MGSHIRTTLALVLVGLVAATLASRVPGASANADPSALLQSFINSANRGDTAAALALVTDDAVIDFAGRPTVRGTAAIRAFLEDHSRAGVQVTVTSVTVSGTTATARVEVRAPTFRVIGIERTIEAVTVETTDLRISRLRSVADESDAQTAAFLRFQAAPPLPPSPALPPLRPPAAGDAGLR